MVDFGIPNVTLLRAIGFSRAFNAGMPYAFNISSDVLGRPVDFCFSTVPVSLN